MDYEKFIKLWLDNTQTKELAQQLGVSTATVYIVTKRLRAAGVQLPDRVYSYNAPFDVDALNTIIKNTKK